MSEVEIIVEAIKRAKVYCQDRMKVAKSEAEIIAFGSHEQVLDEVCNNVRRVQNEQDGLSGQ